MKIHTENIERKVANKKLNFATHDSQTVTLPSKYRSPRSRDFRQYYFHYILVGGVAIAIFFGILNSVEKYGSGFLSGWTIENTLIFVGIFTIFVLTLLFSRRIFKKIIGKSNQWEMTLTEYLIFRYGSRCLAFVVLVLGLMFVMFLDNLK